MFGTAGGILEFRSALLASRGIASFSLPYFRYEDLPDTMIDLDFQYFIVSIYACSRGVLTCVVINTFIQLTTFL